jgi:hypothetical protein
MLSRWSFVIEPLRLVESCRDWAARGVMAQVPRAVLRRLRRSVTQLFRDSSDDLFIYFLLHSNIPEMAGVSRVGLNTQLLPTPIRKEASSTSSAGRYINPRAYGKFEYLKDQHLFLNSKVSSPFTQRIKQSSL